MTYYTDSKVVLGYISNAIRRFFVYVANRVQLIKSMCTPEQWGYMETKKNAACPATRGVPESKLMQTSWLVGPECLYKPERTLPFNETFGLSANDSEVHKGAFSTGVNTKKDK